jgi:tetratricopeptide (TPR) repeat protein
VSRWGWSGALGPVAAGGRRRGRSAPGAGNLAVSLLAIGRWDECAQFTGEALVPDSAFAFGLHAWRGLLLTRRGDFAAAREQLERSMRLSPPASRDPAWYGLAELAIWEGRDNEAQGVLAEWQHWCAEVVDRQRPPGCRRAGLAQPLPPGSHPGDGPLGGTAGQPHPRHPHHRPAMRPWRSRPRWRPARPGRGVAIMPAHLLRSALGYDRVLADADIALLATTARTSLRPAA